ncbi:MAG: hydroxymethylbilane synthase, partial [Acidobacteria bacterium]|nr:hydroxymethylbilane synthase [Acidobacteriota bacterium]
HAAAGRPRASRGEGSGGALLAARGGAPRVGTGSVRRVAQLARTVPRARFQSIRGNVETRLRKLDAGDCDALVLAAAGLVRLGLGERANARLTADECLPAPGQGIVAIEIRESDERTRSVLDRIDDCAAGVALAAERALVRALGGDCRVPIGALAVQEADGVALDAVVASLDGRRRLRRQARGPADTAAALGADLASRMLADGAEEILAPHRSPR